MTTGFEYEAVESGSFVRLNTGEYPGRVVDVIEENNDFGKRTRLDIEVVGQKAEDGSPAILRKWCNPKLSPKTNLGIWYQRVTGDKVEFGVGKRYSPRNMIGKLCRLGVHNPDPEKGSRIRDILRAGGQGVDAPASKPLEGAEEQFYTPDDDACRCGKPVFKYAANGQALCEEHAELLANFGAA
jgi:hypothetical protein